MPGPQEHSLEVDGAWVGGTLTGPVRLTVQGGRVRAVQPVPHRGTRRFALPAFANAHAHLDLSCIAGEDLPRTSFAEWAFALVSARRRLHRGDLEAAVREGARRLLATGTAAVGDIDSTGHALAPLIESGLEGVSFLEVIGSVSADEVAQRLEPPGRGNARVVRGISPHAPFSTSELSYRACATVAAGRGAMLATHVAETLEERALLSGRGGPLAALLARLGAAAADWTNREPAMLARVLQILPAGSRCLLVHANHLQPEEEAALVAAGQPVVYCPRSHEFFDHPAPHPAGRLLRQGVVVALGTDSRASNEDLDHWAEMACFRRRDPSVRDHEILACATVGGRRALALEPAELRPGDPATFQVVRARDGGTAGTSRLLAAAVRGELETETLWIAGRTAPGPAGPEAGPG